MKRLTNRLIPFLMVVIGLFMSQCQKSADAPYDVVVYGGTPGGISAAISAAREGAKVLLIEQTKHVGGLSTSGIGTAETEHMIEETFSGFALEFYQRLGDHYLKTLPEPEKYPTPFRATSKIYGDKRPVAFFESKQAEKTYLEMLKEANVEIWYERYVEGVTKEGAAIQSIKLDDGRTVAGKAFVDASYEGDLMARSGVSYTYGRESKEQYGESLAGVRFIDEPIDASPYDDNGNLLPGFVERATLTEGQADKRVINYNFRLNFTKEDDRTPFAKPENYQPERYILLTRLLKNKPETKLQDIIDLYKWRSWDGTFETNNKQKSVISLGHFGANLEYPDGDYAKRKAIYQDHKDWTMGLIYYLANDPSVPEKLRAETNEYGLAADEFTDNGNFPYYLYVREARRMIGAYVHTQKDILEDREKPDAICLGSHWIDSHHVQRVAISKTQFVNEGRIWEPIDRPYEISYRIITPKEEDCTNLLVPVCASTSHVAFCSIRLECTWMQLGEAAGLAAVMAGKQQVPVQKVDTEALKANLVKRGMIIDINHQEWDGMRDIPKETKLLRK
ncbi:FAD-dependent oxidoreductase [Larkinella arboricola]